MRGVLAFLRQFLDVLTRGGAGKIFGNRAEALIRLKKWSLARSSSSSALMMNPDNVKARVCPIPESPNLAPQMM